MLNIDLIIFFCYNDNHCYKAVSITFRNHFYSSCHLCCSSITKFLLFLYYQLDVSSVVLYIHRWFTLFQNTYIHQHIHKNDQVKSLERLHNVIDFNSSFFFFQLDRTHVRKDKKDLTRKLSYISLPLNDLSLFI